MTEPNDQLGDAVDRLFRRTDPVPDHLLRAASASLAWRDVDAALAELTLDSALAGEPAGVRTADTAAPRLLSFAAADLVVDVEVVRRDRRVDMVGQVSRPVASAIEIRHPAGAWAGTTDALGRFQVTDLPAGPMWITWTPPEADAPLFRTPSFLA